MKTGDAKLGDFGISKVMDGTVAEAGTVVGTLLDYGVLTFVARSCVGKPLT